jgi:hypothetical protein
MFRPFGWAGEAFFAETQNLTTRQGICRKDEFGGSFLTAGGISTAAIILFRLP